MQTTTPPTETNHRKSLFGVCAAIGRDFGFNPDYLRILFALSLLWNPAAVLVSYVAIGMIVLVSRWLAPDARPAPAERSNAETVFMPALRETSESTPMARAA